MPFSTSNPAFSAGETGPRDPPEWRQQRLGPKPRCFLLPREGAGLGLARPLPSGRAVRAAWEAPPRLWDTSSAPGDQPPRPADVGGHSHGATAPATTPAVARGVQTHTSLLPRRDGHSQDSVRT